MMRLRSADEPNFLKSPMPKIRQHDSMQQPSELPRVVFLHGTVEGGSACAVQRRLGAWHRWPALHALQQQRVDIDATINELTSFIALVKAQTDQEG